MCLAHDPLSNHTHALIDHGLVSVLGEFSDGDLLVFATVAEEEPADREVETANRERSVDAIEERLRGWGERLRRWEDERRVENSRPSS